MIADPLQEVAAYKTPSTSEMCQCHLEQTIDGDCLAEEPHEGTGCLISDKKLWDNLSYRNLGQMNVSENESFLW